MRDLQIFMDDLLRNSTKIEMEMTRILTKISWVEEYSGSNSYRLKELNEDKKELIRKLIREYELWFTGAKEIILQFIEERSEEFFKADNEIRYIFQVLKGKYDTLQSSEIPTNDAFIESFDLQKNILECIIPKIKMKEVKIKKIISGDLIESELERADYLFENNFIREAGVLAGVALERHLKTMCELNGLSYGAKDTIQPLAENLYKNKIIEITFLKSIEHLASIRNKSSHSEEIKKPEIRELIDKTKKITFMGL
jgi:hypothetical protein